jgi:hypothetical protein
MRTFTGTVLALDLATTTGWAFGAPGHLPEFGHLRFTKKGSSRAETYRAFRNWLDITWGKRGEMPDLIVYESPALSMHMGGKTNIDTTRLLMGLAEHLEEWAHGRCDLREATASQVRCHFIGQNLRASIAKPMVLERCQAMGWMCGTTDESDACALWDYQCCWLDPQIAARSTPLFYPKRGPTTFEG